MYILSIELLLLSESYYGRGMTEKAESLLHRIIASLPLIEKPADVLLQGVYTILAKPLTCLSLLSVGNSLSSFGSCLSSG